MSASGFTNAFNPTLLLSSLERRPSNSATGNLEFAGDLLPQPSTSSTILQQPIPLIDLRSFSRHSHDSLDGDVTSNERARLVAPEEFEFEFGEEDGLAHDKHMNRKTHPRRDADGSPHANGDDQEHQNGDMASPLEHRMKHSAAADGSLASSSLLGRDSLIFQEEDTSKEREDGSGAGFFDLPLQDRRNFLLLVLLYFLQGIPMGLAGGSVPFLLKSAKYGVSYGQIGIFSLASYPYSLKLLWSPIVDAVWSRRIGRRKSWILPVQVFSGLGMLWLGANAEAMMTSAGANGGAGIWGFTGWWFFLVFTCATQDIAVDGEFAISHCTSDLRVAQE